MDRLVLGSDDVQCGAKSRDKSAMPYQLDKFYSEIR